MRVSAALSVNYDEFYFLNIAPCMQKVESFALNWPNFTVNNTDGEKFEKDWTN